MNDHFEEMKFDDLENFEEDAGSIDPTEMHLKDKPRHVSTRQPDLDKMYDQKPEPKQDQAGADTKLHKTDSKDQTKSEAAEDFPELFKKHRAMKLTGYVNFNHKSDRFLDQYDFSWSIHGYDRLSQFLPKITETLSTQMNHAFIMTNTSFAGQQVDTIDYRNAIVFYLKEIHGIRDESIKYKRINELLEID
jgi:hypothetical protein